MSTHDQKQAILGILRASRARFLSDACYMAGVDPYVVHSWRKEDFRFSEELAAALDYIKQRRLDEAEAILDKKVREGDMSAINMFLKTQGRDRNYNDRVDIGDAKALPADMDEAAKRIAFALNHAKRKGKLLQGSATEVESVAQPRQHIKALTNESE